ncbi:hypothetical protein ACTQV2_00830 [Bifidobacterium thermophilum]|uniref:hypothetical protein n=1 Tax=Bifidobacterium thermophilum TaxID=33905 RepID=UPI003F904022
MADDTVIVVDLLACLSAGLSAVMLLLAVWRVSCDRFPGALAAGGEMLLAAAVPGLWWGTAAVVPALVMFAFVLVGLGPAIMAGGVDA